MADHRTHLPAPDTHVFRVDRDGFSTLPSGCRLSEIPNIHWQQIVSGQRPLQPANASVRMLVISGAAANPTIDKPTCDSIDALQLQTDDHGYLLTWHPGYPESASITVRQLKNSSAVIDARAQFLRRHLAHRHNWQPTADVLAEALYLAGYPL